MSEFTERLLKFHNWWNGVAKIKASLQREANPLRFGVLGAAAINFPALFDSIDTHPATVLVAIAARSLSRAREQITKYKLKDVQAYGSYDELLTDPKVDAVYIPLPNGLHCEWAIKAMEAGKHVLIEKPICANSDESRRVAQTSESTGKVALEAFHWRFHPAAHTVKDMVSSGQYGAVQAVSSKINLPAPMIPEGDIRFKYDLAGGACMDLCYIFSTACYFAVPDEIAKYDFEVQTANPRVNRHDSRVDDAMIATFSVINPNDSNHKVDCTVNGDLARPKLWGWIPRYWELPVDVRIELERARVDFYNFLGPWLRHSIVTTEKDERGNLTGKKKTQKCLAGGPYWSQVNKDTQPWWTTYRYQLEAFVAQVRAKETGSTFPGPWVGLDESIKVMELIDLVVQKAGLPKRGG